MNFKATSKPYSSFIVLANGKAIDGTDIMITNLKRLEKLSIAPTTRGNWAILKKSWTASLTASLVHGNLMIWKIDLSSLN